MSTLTDTSETAQDADWKFIVERCVQLSVRREAFVVGRLEHGQATPGDWFSCQAGILGRVDGIETGPVLNESGDHVVLTMQRGAIAVGDVLSGWHAIDDL